MIISHEMESNHVLMCKFWADYTILHGVRPWTLTTGRCGWAETTKLSQCDGGVF